MASMKPVRLRSAWIDTVEFSPWFGLRIQFRPKPGAPKDEPGLLLEYPDVTREMFDQFIEAVPPNAHFVQFVAKKMLPDGTRVDRAYRVIEPDEPLTVEAAK